MRSNFALKTIYFVVQISAKNKDSTNYSDSFNVTATCFEDRSARPENFTYEFNEQLRPILKWKYPSITNGPLKYFVVTFKNDTFNITKNKSIENDKLNYTMEVSF